jgi:nitroimidazol reductase NimA-like FMN-containing flavoprotein (pyridoxamine 5'-phosphate oxidase superfamily)
VVHAILDSAYVCQIAFIDAGEPRVVRMSYWRDGEFVHFHSAARGRLARVRREGRVAISVTVMDGLVQGHSAINHPINHRSVVIRGQPTAIRRSPGEVVRPAAVLRQDHPGALGRIGARCATTNWTC